MAEARKFETTQSHIYDFLEKVELERQKADHWVLASRGREEDRSNKYQKVCVIKNSIILLCLWVYNYMHIFQSPSFIYLKWEHLTLCKVYLNISVFSKIKAYQEFFKIHALIRWPDTGFLQMFSPHNSEQNMHTVLHKK